MDEKVLAAARQVLKSHHKNDCPGTAAAGVALAHMITQRADAATKPSKFSFAHGLDLEEPQEKAGPTVSP